MSPMPTIGRGVRWPSELVAHQITYLRPDPASGSWLQKVAFAILGQRGARGERLVDGRGTRARARAQGLRRS
jgi:hypothetical protein